MDIGTWSNTNDILDNLSTYSWALILIGVAILIISLVLLTKVNLIIENQQKILKQLKPHDKRNTNDPPAKKDQGNDQSNDNQKRGTIFF